MADSALSTADLFTIIIKSGYGASIYKLEKTAAEQTLNREKIVAQNAEKHSYQSLICRLKKDGLISDNLAKLTLTPKGIVKLKKIKEKDEFASPEYKKSESANFVIFSYDISGKKFQERRWLKEALLNLGLRPIQQSVWIGKIRLPEAFLNDLKRLDILKYIEIFEITKKGTLREM